MFWNYRIVRHPNGDLALHEVYDDEDGRPDGVTARPVGFAADAEEGVGDLIRQLELALGDARNRPVLDWSEVRGLRPENLGGRLDVEPVIGAKDGE